MKSTVRNVVFFVLVLFLIAAAEAVPLSATISTTGTQSPEKPYVSGTVSAATVTAGQPVTISGIATGNTTPGIEIWIFGNSYAKQANVPVDANGSYSYSFDTAGLSPQQYFVLIQDPGTNGVFGLSYNSGTGYIVNTAGGTNIAQVMNNGTMMVNATQAVSVLSNALNSQSVDDVYTKVSFGVTAAPETTVTTVPASPVIATGAATAATKVPATKTPLSPVITIIGIGITVCAFFLRRDRQ